MNTEIFDYIKALSKKEHFLINSINVIFSAAIIICALLSMRDGATMLRYLIMFACATFLLGLNSFKCFKRKSKNGWVFLIMSIFFAVITVLALMAVLRGGGSSPLGMI